MNNNPDPNHPGTSFERYVRKYLFIHRYYKQMERSHPYTADPEHYVESNLKPDFTFEDNLKNIEFYVEAKWRRKHTDGKIIWYDKITQLNRYKKYATEKPFFLIIGTGKNEETPENLYLLPLSATRDYHILFPSLLNPYKIPIEKPVTSNSLWGRCTELQIEKKIPEQVVVKSNQEISNKELTPKKQSKKILWIISVFLIALVGTFLFLYQNGKFQQYNSEQQEIHTPKPYTVIEKQDIKLTYLIKDNSLSYERTHGWLLLDTKPKIQIHCVVTNTSEHGGLFKLYAKLSCEKDTIVFQKEEYIGAGFTKDFLEEKEINDFTFEDDINLDKWGITAPTISINVQRTKYM